MRGRFATFALIAAVVLAGCTSTPGHPADPGSTAPAISSPVTTPTTPATVSDPPDTSSAATSPPPALGTEVPADVPTTGPNLRHKGERPPVMPLLATKHTPAGAAAFAKFFIQTIDWGFATTSGAYMRHYFLQRCQSCISLSDGMDHARRQGHRYTGGRFTIRDASRTKAATLTDPVRTTITVDATAFEETTRSGAFYQGGPARRDEQFTVATTWRGSAWHVTSLTVAQ